MSKVSILVVEDNQDMRQAVCSYLRDLGYVVSQSATAEQVLSGKLYEGKDILLLDILLPKMSGLELTQELRSLGFSQSIIGLTARDTIDDKILGLETGMNDYIVKPFDLRELDARINVQLRLADAYHDLRTVTTKSFKIEPKRHKFFAYEQAVKLTAVEFRLMLRLMQSNHSAVTTADIIEYAWGDDAMLTNPPIRIHISNLRTKINDKHLQIISTVPGVGYMLQD